ncbi:hypothetical protein KCU82_g24470, partial [Aureobasidium melanogenum]
IKPVFADAVDTENEDNMDVDNGVGAGDKDSRESTIVNGVEALYRPFDHPNADWMTDQRLVERRLERVVETLQILQPMRTEAHASLRRMMEKAKTRLLACLQEKFGESDSGREWRRRVEALQATT